jgi:hypothetical protein
LSYLPDGEHLLPRNLEEHFEREHNPVLGLIVRLDETCVSSRLAWGLALQGIITTIRWMKNFEFHKPSEHEAASVITALGGYAPKNEMSVVDLRSAIMHARFQLVPEVARARLQATYARQEAEKLSSRPSSAASNSAEPGTGYAQAVRKKPPPPPAPYRPPDLEIQTIDLEQYCQSRQNTPQMTPTGRSAAATPSGSANPSLLQRCAPPPVAATPLPLGTEPSMPPPPEPRMAPQPRPEPLQLQPPPHKTVVYHAVRKQSSPDVPELCDEITQMCRNHNTRDPLNLKPEGRGKPEKPRGARNDPDYGEQSEDENEGVYRRWAEECPTPPMYAPRGGHYERYSPYRVDVEEDDNPNLGYSPNHPGRNHMETDD